jgi:hypothetical protein
MPRKSFRTLSNALRAQPRDSMGASREAVQRLIATSPVRRTHGTVSANPPFTRRDDPPSQLPPGALPPQMEPRLTRRQWWSVNKWAILVPVIAVLVVAGLWAAETVPLVSTTQSFSVAIPLTHPAGYNQFFGQAFLGRSEGGTLTGTFWAPSGTVMILELHFGSDSFSSNNSTGSFHLSVAGHLAIGYVFVETSAATTVYVNGTQTYLVPLI